MPGADYNPKLTSSTCSIFFIFLAGKRVSFDRKFIPKGLQIPATYHKTTTQSRLVRT